LTPASVPWHCLDAGQSKYDFFRHCILHGRIAAELTANKLRNLALEN
jgi:hypothetical protein